MKLPKWLISIGKLAIVINPPLNRKTDYMTTNYAGIDYGLGKTNIDANGIRYGVISQNSLNPEALDEIFSTGRDLTFENYQAEAKDKLRDALSDYFSDHKWNDKPSKLDEAVSDAFDAIEQDLNDQYEHNGEAQYLYEGDSLRIETCLSNDLIVTKSEYFTYAQFCSPCVPGACNLDSPLGMEDKPTDCHLASADNRCYCLGHDWFDDGKAPYPVYCVATGQIVEP